MAYARLKKILCNFEFSYVGYRFMACGFYLGDTSNPKSIASRDFTPAIVCQTLRITRENLANFLKCKYWDINQERMAKAGIVFTKLDIYFYPPRER